MGFITSVVALGILFTFRITSVCGKCTQSPTTASGTHAPAKICSGRLIFKDDFKFLDFSKWQHENTLAGNGVSRHYYSIVKLIDHFLETNDYGTIENFSGLQFLHVLLKTWFEVI